MKAFSYEHSYQMHRTQVSHFWLMTLQYIFLTVAIACIIAIVWFPERWIPAAVTAVVLLIAGAACKSGRQ